MEGDGLRADGESVAAGSLGADRKSLSAWEPKESC